MAKFSDFFATLGKMGDGNTNNTDTLADEASQTNDNQNDQVVIPLDVGPTVPPPSARSNNVTILLLPHVGPFLHLLQGCLDPVQVISISSTFNAAVYSVSFQNLKDVSKYLGLHGLDLLGISIPSETTVPQLSSLGFYTKE